MPRYFFHLMLGPRMVARDDAGHECPNDAAAHEFARLSAGLFVSDLLLLVRTVLFRGRHRRWGASLSIQCRMKPS